MWFARDYFSLRIWLCGNSYRQEPHYFREVLFSHHLSNPKSHKNNIFQILLLGFCQGEQRYMHHCCEQWWHNHVLLFNLLKIESAIRVITHYKTPLLTFHHLGSDENSPSFNTKTKDNQADKTWLSFIMSSASFCCLYREACARAEAEIKAVSGGWGPTQGLHSIIFLRGKATIRWCLRRRARSRFCMGGSAQRPPNGFLATNSVTSGDL